MEDHQQLLIELMRLADRVTMARLGLLKEMSAESDKPAKWSVASPEQWDNYLTYFRQTYAYLAASVRDGYATMDSPANPVPLE